MALFVGAMIYRYGTNGMAAWDLVVPVIGAAAALTSAYALHVNHRAQTRREQCFGESLRDQLNRSIAQLDDQVTSARRTSVVVLVLMGGIVPMTILVVGWRINQKPVSDDGYQLFTLIGLCVVSVWYGVWSLRSEVLRKLLPRQRRLKALLKELDDE